MPRRRYLRNWHAVKYCSRACALGGRKTQSVGFEKAIIDLLADRQPGAFLRPAEVAMGLAPDGDWQALVDDVVRAARRLAHQDQIVLMEDGASPGESNADSVRMERGPAFDPTPWESDDESLPE